MGDHRKIGALLRWLAFNAIAGNADGHGKNLSLILADGRRLAQFYDLVCTRAYDGLDRRLAMSVGGERDPDRLRPPHLDECAASLDVKPRLLHATFARMAESIAELLENAPRSKASASCNVPFAVVTLDAHRAALADVLEVDRVDLVARCVGGHPARCRAVPSTAASRRPSLGTGVASVS